MIRIRKCEKDGLCLWGTKSAANDTGRNEMATFKNKKGEVIEIKTEGIWKALNRNYIFPCSEYFGRRLYTKDGSIQIDADKLFIY